MRILIISNQLSNKNKTSNPVVDNTINAFEKDKAIIERLPVETNEYGFLAYFYLFIRLCYLKYIKNIKYDVVHVHFGGIQSLITSLFFRRNLIVSFHGSDLHGGSPNSRLSFCKSRLNVFCSKFSIRYCKKCTVVSNSLIEFIPISYRNKVSIISTGVNYDVFYPIDKESCKGRLGLLADCKYILFSDISGSSIKRRDIADNIINFLINSGFEYKLLIMSNVAYESVPLYINASEFVLIVSDNEGSPNIVKEALACETPIYSVDVGDVHEYIILEESCMLLPSQDPSAISNEIIFKSKLLCKPISRDVWKGNINIESIAKKYMELYCGL